MHRANAAKPATAETANGLRIIEQLGGGLNHAIKPKSVGTQALRPYQVDGVDQIEQAIADGGNTAVNPKSLGIANRWRMSSAVLRLKMSIVSVKSSCDLNGTKISEEITLQAVYSPEGSPNAQWSKWTSAANLTMHVNNPDAFGKVLSGQFFFVDLVPTTKDAI